VRRPCLSTAALALLLFAAALPGAAAAIDVKRAEVREFIERAAKQGPYNRSQLRKLLGEAQSQQSIIDAMDKPAERAKLWYEYRPIFVNEKRTQEGADFWAAHRAELAQAAEKSGVAPEYIVAILGVETYYGRLMGRYRVLDALSTLAFDYPPRAKFFQEELEAFLSLTREDGIDPLTATGSYAGAMGAPQFMPSAYRRYAVDANQDGRIDLWTNWPDVFASVGNFLKEHGWIAGGPVLSEATAPPDIDARTEGRKLGLSETVASLQARGFRFEAAEGPAAPAVLIAADEVDGARWRVGYNNFHVITRYNHSALYAMAVFDLAAAVKQRLATTVAAAP
jgi:membrane-bound lytic murein transglycosylase B